MHRVRWHGDGGSRPSGRMQARSTWHRASASRREHRSEDERADRPRSRPDGGEDSEHRESYAPRGDPARLHGLHRPAGDRGGAAEPRPPDDHRPGRRGGDVGAPGRPGARARRPHGRGGAGHRRPGPPARPSTRRHRSAAGRRASTPCPRSSPARGRRRSWPPAPRTSSSTGSPARSGSAHALGAAGRAHRRAGEQGVTGRRRTTSSRAAAAPGQLVPVDSEHSALAQCLRGGARGEVARLVLTASGGPFRGRPPTSSTTSPWTRPSRTRPGPWARSSRSTPRRWSTRAWS